MSLKAIDQFPFEFYGETFTVALANDRNLYVPMEALCTAMELQTHGQIRRIRESEAMDDALVDLNIVWSYGDDEAREREMVCLRLDRLPFWMGTIQTNRFPTRRNGSASSSSSVTSPTSPGPPSAGKYCPMICWPRWMRGCHRRSKRT
jgi:hypothetical protein